MQLEQASKVEMRAPTRRITGEGRVNGEGIDTCTRSVRRGSEHGTLDKVVRVIGGDPRRRGAGLDAIAKDGGLKRESDRGVVASRPGNSGGAKAPDFWCAFDES